MTLGEPVIFQEDGAWIVAVLVAPDKLQRYRCPTEEKARAFCALFGKPPRKQRARAKAKPRFSVPRVFVRALAWG